MKTKVDLSVAPHLADMQNCPDARVFSDGVIEIETDSECYQSVMRRVREKVLSKSRSERPKCRGCSANRG